MKLVIAVLILTLGGWTGDPPTEPLPQTQNPVTLRFHEDSEMTVRGTSNVHDWDMEVETINGQIDLRPAEDGSAPRIERLKVEIPVESIVSDKGRQNRKTYDALKSNRYPTIYFNASEVEVTPEEGGRFTATARGELIIAGERRTVDVQATGTPLDGGGYRFQGEHALLLSDFDIDRPSAMLGTIRVGDEITLAFDVILASQ